MTDLVRLSFSINRTLGERFETMVEGSGYHNRSEFIRDLIRDRLVQDEWEADTTDAVGTITLVFDHHTRGLHGRLTGMQHDHHHVILATTHVHLDHDLCAEVIICRGRPSQIRSIADSLRQAKGVLHGDLTMTTAGIQLR